MGQSTRRTLLVMVASLACGGMAQAVDFRIELRTTTVGGVVSQYAGTVMPFSMVGEVLPFATARISNADNSVVSHTISGGWSFQAGSYASLPDMITSLEQPWQIVLNEGLPSEHSYSMQLELGDFATNGFDPFFISSPTHQSVVPTLTPSFALSTTPNFFVASLREFNGGATVADTLLLPGTTSWSPGVTLSPGVEYIINTYTDVTRNDVFFTVPVDTNNQAYADWQSHGLVHLEAASVFTVVPEPATVSMLGLGIALLGVGCVVRRRSR